MRNAWVFKPVGALAGDAPSISENDLQKGYLGFVVVKRLPQTIFGRTALQTYSPSGQGGSRHYPIKFTNTANLFGLQLAVESLPFQEQDTVAAKCATSALWVIFQATGRQFHHPIPSPVEITTAAAGHADLETRTLPSSGLTTAQMAQAIRDVGLEPFLIGARKRHVLLGSLYGYLRAGIPPALVFWLVDTSVPLVSTLMGRHAVAITGYGLSESPPTPAPGTGFLLRASRIDRIYVHDDQVGPFARMKDDGVLVSPSGPDGKPTPDLTNAFSLHTSWRGDKSNVIGTARAIPDNLLAPLYHKVRIPFSAVHDAVAALDAVLEKARNAGALPLNQRIEWDIFLTTVNEVKETVLAASAIDDGEYRRAVLTEDMPRFLWCAAALDAEVPVFDLLFDATDIEQSNFFHRAIEYSKQACAVLRVFGKAKHLPPGPVRNILSWFGDQ